jgi:hypothetical protein
MERVADTTQTTSPKKTIRRQRFTPDEDNRLKLAVAEYGPNKWPFVAQAVGPNRTARQVRDRWSTYLDPEWACAPTDAEDAVILELHQTYNGECAKVGAMINRSATWVRNRYRSLRSTRSTRNTVPLQSSNDIPVPDFGSPDDLFHYVSSEDDFVDDNETQ